MAYIGTSPSQGVRRVHTYTATANQTSFSGAGAEGATLSYKDSNFVDVYQNGVKLGDADYTATSGTAIVLGTGATVSDLVVIVAYDVFSAADTVSKADGGQFDGNVTMAGTLAVTGETTLATHLNMGDGDIIKLGASADLTIQHDGSNSIITDAGTGRLKIQGSRVDINKNDGSEGMAAFIEDAQVILYHNNAVKLQTDATGILVGSSGVNATLSTSSAGTSNLSLGVNAGNSIASGGNYNVLVGDEAGTALTTGDNNVAVGYKALKTEDAHGTNVAVGTEALETLNVGAEGYNVAIGHKASEAETTGKENTMVGAFAGGLGTLAGRSVGLGYSALYRQNPSSSTDTYNIAIGYNAGSNVTTGTLNTLVGGLAGDALTTGGANTAVGYEALTTSQDGSNTALGYRALYDMTSGARNVGLGEQGGRGITTGNDNIGAGQQSFYAACTGSANVGLGYRSFFSATSAASNVGVGYQTLSDMNSGSENVAVGYRALPHVSTGDSNIGIGIQTGDGDRGTALTTGASNILMGRQVDVAAADNSYCGVFGVHAVGKGSSTGYFSFNDGAIYQGNNNANWTTTSDIRIKKNIVDSNIGLEELKKIQVRNFEYRTKDEITEVPSHAAINKQGVQVGVIAQEIQAVLPDTVKEESTGVLSVNPDNLTWHLVKAIQELSAKNDVLEARIKKLEES